jgi:hypothetical protein
MSTTIKAFRLYKDSTGGSEWMRTVYTDREVAEMEAASKHEEWASYKVHPVKVRVLSANEGVIGHELVTIDRTTAIVRHRQVALSKLSKKEKDALLRPLRAAKITGKS